MSARWRIGWATPARARHIYLIAAALGLAVYLIVYGGGHLFGTTAYWTMPQQDERMALMGYRYFLDEGWHWPVFANHAIDVPYATSVAFNDCIPLWALINKLIATLIPPWGELSETAYLGLWHGLVYALQAAFGVACLRALGHRSWAAGIVTALFFLAVPAWIFRYGHAALSAHWIELWALWLYLLTPSRARTPTRLGVAMLGQLTVAALVTPYHPIMSLGIFAAALLRSRDLRTIAIWFPLGLACVALATWFAGYFAGEGSVDQWGFARQSANALSWLIPVRSGIIGDGRWIADVMATDWQWEGYAYLGLGYLGLLALLVPHIGTLRGVLRRHAVLFAVAVGFGLVALSNHIYVGSHEIASYQIPWFVKWFAHQFRAPGRFVWIPMYVVMAFLLHWGFTRFTTPRRFAVMVGLLVVQLIDARGDWKVQREWTSGPRASVRDHDAWRRVVHAHDAVVIEPTFACLTPERDPRVSDAAMAVQMLASERALPINGTYSTRTTRDCAQEQNAWPAITPGPNTLYVVLPQANPVVGYLQAKGAHCAALETVHVCSMNEGAITEASRNLHPPRT